MSIAVNPREMRRVPREDVCFQCEMSGLGFGLAKCLMVNISPLGCMIRCSKDIQPDTMVGLVLPLAGPIQARVIWAIGGRLGLEFSRPIDIDIFEKLLPHLRRPGDEMGSY